MQVHDDLGIRMKEFYESVPKTRLTRRIPIAIRLDGKAFHTFTRGFKKPFDKILMRSMQQTMKYLCENIQGCVLGYTQSDEITLILIDYKKLNSEAWFDYEVQKMCSVSASMATMTFNKYFYNEILRWYDRTVADGTFQEQENIKLMKTYQTAAEKGAMFDARVFNIPKEEVANLIYWRQLDATRNSIQMVGQAWFSHKELQNKSCNMIQDMLLTQKNINWNKYPTVYKRGSCCIKKEATDICAEFNIDGSIVTKPAERPHWEIDLDIPIFKGENRMYINEKILYYDEAMDYAYVK